MDLHDASCYNCEHYEPLTDTFKICGLDTDHKHWCAYMPHVACEDWEPIEEEKEQ